MFKFDADFTWLSLGINKLEVHFTLDAYTRLMLSKQRLEVEMSDEGMT